MKYYILILSMIIGSACYGQKLDTSKPYSLYEYAFVGDTTAFTKLDTIPVIMLYCNTEPQEYVSHYWPLRLDWGTIVKDTSYTIFETDYSIKWMLGYRVKSMISSGYYIDKDKQPLPKNIIVWIAK